MEVFVCHFRIYLFSLHLIKLTIASMVLNDLSFGCGLIERMKDASKQLFRGRLITWYPYISVKSLHLCLNLCTAESYYGKKYVFGDEVTLRS